MPNQDNNNDGVYVSNESGIVNESTYPDQILPNYDITEDNALVNMYHRLEALQPSSGEFIETFAEIKQIIWSSKQDPSCPQNFYECVIAVVGDLYSVVQSYPSEVKLQSQAVQNFSRRAEGFLDARPQINQRVRVSIPKTYDPSIMGRLLKLEDTDEDTVGGKTLKTVPGASAQNAFQQQG